LKIFEVACGRDFTIILSKENKKVRVFASGSKNFGKLGLGNVTSNVKGFVEIVSLQKKKIRRIYTKVNHVVAISKSREMYVWGLNTHGQLGLGHKQNLLEP